MTKHKTTAEWGRDTARTRYGAPSVKSHSTQQTNAEHKENEKLDSLNLPTESKVGP